MFKILIALLISSFAMAQAPSEFKPNASSNYLINGDFEKGKTGWKSTDVTFTMDTGSTRLDKSGKQSASLTSSAAAGYFYKAIQVDKNLAGKSCSMEVLYENTDDTLDAYLTVFTGATMGGLTEVSSDFRVTFPKTPTDQSGIARISAFICPQVDYYVQFRIVFPTTGKSLKIDNAKIGLTQFGEVLNVTSWKVEGPITITATTTNPTKGVSSVDKVESRQVGENYEFIYTYQQTASTGASAGSGDYIFALPSGKTFPSGTLYFTGADPNVGTAQKIPCTSAMFFQDGSTYNGVGCTIVPYSSTTFRVYVYSVGASPSKQFINSTSYRLNFATMNYNFGFTFKGDGLSNSATVINAECPSIGACEDLFTADINTSGTITNQTPTNWLTSCTSFAPSVCTFVTNHFSVTPKCWAATTASATASFGFDTAYSGTTSVTMDRKDEMGARRSINYTLFCRRATTDFKGKRVLQADLSVIAASYYASSNKSASTTTPIDFDSKIIDTNNAVTTGGSWKFTAPKSGLYNVSVLRLYTTGSINTSVNVRKNGTVYASISSILYTYGVQGSGSIIIELAAGDYIDITLGASGTILGGSLSSSDVGKISINKL